MMQPLNQAADTVLERRGDFADRSVFL